MKGKIRDLYVPHDDHRVRRDRSLLVELLVLSFLLAVLVALLFKQLAGSGAAL